MVNDRGRELALWATLVLFLGLFLSGARESAGLDLPIPAATRIPAAERGFESRVGWIGGDGAYSLPLATDTVLWLFGDSFFGEVRAGRRLSRVMVHNAIALQHGAEASQARWSYWFGPTDNRPVGAIRVANQDWLPGSFFQPPDGRGYFWPLHGIRTRRGLFVFLLQIEPTGKDSVFGFKPTGSWLVRVPIDDLSRPPDQWRRIYQKIPWASFAPDGNRFFGSSVLPDGDGLLVYGIEEQCPDPPTGKKLLLARITGDDPSRFGNWRILETIPTPADPGNPPSLPIFGVRLQRATPLLDGLATEFSIHRSHRNGLYTLVHMAPGLSPEIVVRLSENPFGPWSPARTIFRCPVGDPHPPHTTGRIRGTLFAYAAKAHPELSDDRDGLLLTWVINSFDFFDLARAAELYRPRFIRWMEPGRRTAVDAP